MQATDPMIRGYAIPATARFILANESLKSSIPAAAREKASQLVTWKAPAWLPRKDAIELWRLVDQASPDEEMAYQNLVSCGRFIADEALNTFLKLLLRMLTPNQFARKFPDIWTHEHTSGYVEALVDKNTMEIRIRDVEGFAHVGPIGTGFVTAALTALGLKDLKIRDTTWTRARPDARDVVMQIAWR